MSGFQVTSPARGFYTASHPISKDSVVSSDLFWYGRKNIERNQVFRVAIHGDSEGSLNVNTDRLLHRPHDIVDHINRPKPLSSMSIN